MANKKPPEYYILTKGLAEIVGKIEELTKRYPSNTDIAIGKINGEVTTITLTTTIKVKT